MSEAAGDQFTETLLYVDGVNVSFDGFRALNDLSLVLEPGEMRAVIGPNGAGKTTMMDVITGKTRPDTGKVVFGKDTDLTKLDEPVAGMTDAETEQTAELLRDINRTRSVVVVEHDMAFVRALGVKVTVLHEGSTLAEGSLDQVSADPRVVEVYLGR